MDVARDPVAVKRRIGVVPQANNLDLSLTGRENLLVHAAHFGIPRLERERRAQELVERFQLAERADGFSLFFTFSGLRQFDRRAID